MNNTSVDSFLTDGCGRCDKYQTPDCKVHLWTEPLVALRALVAESELVEAMKWGFPTYTLEGNNVLMIVAFKGFCGLSFLKGVAIKDDAGLLEKPGPNTRFARVLKFQTLEDVSRHREAAADFIRQAVAFQRSGVEIELEDAKEPMPAELASRLDIDDDLRRAFDALTPGRQRSYILHVSGAKKAQTRANRVEKCAPKIFAGKGFNER